MIACFIATVRGIDLFGDIIAFKEDVINGIFGGINDLGEGVFGKGKCGCPCRDYYVPKCEITYVQQCYYEHYEQVCSSVPVPQVREVKEIECQKCRKYKVPRPKTKWVKECNPVYDEKCKTEYHQHCKEMTRCHVLYQTICDNSGYQQHCESQPRQHCYPETKCHRTPETKCVPVQKEKCTKVPVETTQYVEEKQCLPFELDLGQLSAQHGNPCASYGQGTLNAQDHQVHHQVTHHQSNQGLAPSSAYQTNFNDQLSTGYTATPNDQYVQPQFTQQVIPSPANEFGVQDPILQHQPISDQYEVKRENTEKTLATKAVGNDYHNPFLRRPKSVRVTVKRFDNLAEDNVDDGTKGWIPIPYPIYKN